MPGLIILVVIVGGWIYLAIRGYRKAVENGYSELAAAVGAFLLGPLAPLMGAVKPRGKKCKFCQSIIDEKATVCPKCTRGQ